MRPKIILMSVCIAVFLSVPGNVAYALQQTDLLDRPVGPLNIRGETIDRILETISVLYKIPMGIELADSKKSPDREIAVHLPEMVLRSYLDYLVMEDPRYAWKLEGQVIHFFPVKDRDNVLTTLLDTNLSRVSFSSETSEYALKSEIMDLPEIKAKLDGAQVQPLVFANGPSMKKIGVALEHSNLTLRELLAQITLTTTRRFWVLLRWGDNNKYIALRL